MLNIDFHSDGQSKNPAINHQKLIAYIHSGQLSQAEQMAYNLILLDQADFFAHKIYGSLLVQSERYQEAIASLEQAYTLKPEDTEILNNLGQAYYKLEQFDEALKYYNSALAQRSDFAECLNNKGMVLHALGRLNEAIDIYDRAIILRPKYLKAHNNRGAVLRDLKRYQEALASHDRALAIEPQNAEAHSLCGMVFQQLGQLHEALACQLRALAIQPNNPGIWVTLGLILSAKGMLTQALIAFDQALALNPRLSEAINNRGLILRALGRLSEARACFEKALIFKPCSVEALNNLAILQHQQGQLDSALETLNKALTFNPNHVSALINRSTVLRDMGQLDTALSDLAQAQTFEPDSVIACSNALFILNYHPDHSAETIFDAYREFDRRFGQPHRAAWLPHPNRPDPERRLRLGYVSPDFRGHSACHALEPLLTHHDRAHFELTAYAELTQEDALTAVYRRLVDHWVPTRGLSDDELAARIRADGIDILVDLAGHTANNRLGVFARRPAPVSVTWMGYGSTTGLSAIDYFLADATLAPEGSEALFAEQPWRLDRPLAIHRPVPEMGEVSPLPAHRRGYVTFGTLTRHVRINHRTLRTWATILQRLPGSRLVIDSKDFAAPSMQQRLTERFEALGIAPERLEIGYHSPPWDVLRGIDIGLDCFPHNSGVTLYETLYMGLPFITLADRPSVGRIGSTILTALGHPEWIAASETDYVERALALAADLDRLAALRAGLRAEMEHSPIRDEGGFVRSLERAYRRMWQLWCRTSIRHNS
ncbi:tetratricopeptide repeat protein [Allochromatium humboldtianum]|uniref:protein O-GlcNAc transferase n=1 Tax=Allochromatium humboldtianum TaxID=504901 RepID=A0A850RBU9_9GAMM|nr:tetratricopeptide repeat protein [Allochromatium humboldtianum]NVZ10285.1 tetratricopeptide repeat protein [Allochromatium humboldtianum]